MPGPEDIKEEEAFYIFCLLFMFPRMVSLGLITKEQAADLQSVLNDKLHEALGLS